MKVHNIEQRSSEWLELKKGKIGGTRNKQIKVKGGLPLIYELLGEEGLCELEESYQSPKMKEAADMEPVAIIAYEKISGINIINSGWWESDFSELVGLSPDGSDNTYTHGVEVKCPLAKTHVEYIINNIIPKVYMPQVIHYFVVNETLEKLDFVSFNPYYLPKPIWIKRVTREELTLEIEAATFELNNFLLKLAKYRELINN